MFKKTLSVLGSAAAGFCAGFFGRSADRAKNELLEDPNKDGRLPSHLYETLSVTIIGAVDLWRQNKLDAEIVLHIAHIAAYSGGAYLGHKMASAASVTNSFVTARISNRPYWSN